MTVLSVLLVFLLLVLGSCFWVYRFGFYSPNRTQNDDFAVAVVPKGDPRRPVVEAMIAAVRELPYESVSIRSHDGLRLCGRYIHQHDGAPLDIRLTEKSTEEDVEKTVVCLRQLPAVTEIMQEEPRLLRIRVNGEEETCAAVLRELARQEIPVCDYHRAPINLEKVFMEVTQDDA